MTVSNFLTWIKAFRRGTVHLSNQRELSISNQFGQYIYLCLESFLY
jgi:hypothetical protein